MKQLTLILIMSLCSGCFGTAIYIKEYIVAPGSHRSINLIDCTYLGVAGPDALWIKNKNGIKIAQKFESGWFPSRLDDLNMNKHEFEVVKNQAKQLIQDYFGSHENIQLITFKVAGREDRTRIWMLDAQVEDNPHTVIELLVRRGLFKLDRDLIERAGLRRFYNLQLDAMRSRLGVWKYMTVSNPSWHD